MIFKLVSLSKVNQVFNFAFFDSEFSESFFEIKSILFRVSCLQAASSALPGSLVAGSLVAGCVAPRCIGISTWPPSVLACGCAIRTMVRLVIVKASHWGSLLFFAADAAWVCVWVCWRCRCSSVSRKPVAHAMAPEYRCLAFEV